LVDDHLVPGLAAFLADYHGAVAGLALPDDGGAPLMARALADRHAGAYGADTDADTGFLGARGRRGHAEAKCNANDRLLHRRFLTWSPHFRNSAFAPQFPSRFETAMHARGQTKIPARTLK